MREIKSGKDNPRYKSGDTLNRRKTDEYEVWAQMKYRCANANAARYLDYGGRGITVCQRWLDSFENFSLDMGCRPSGMSLDRIDNSQGYSPDNCRWADWITQNNNRRNTRKVTVGGESKTIAEWSRISGIAQPQLWTRILHGWPEDKLLTPVNPARSASAKRAHERRRAEKGEGL